MTGGTAPGRATAADEAGMRAAIEVACEGLASGEFPYGAVLVDGSGRVVARRHDTVLADGDYSSHAETMLIKDTCCERGPDLSDLTLYTTTEPCPMCFTTTWLARVPRLVFGNSMQDLYDLNGGLVEEVLVPAETLNALNPNRSMALTPYVLRDECLALWCGIRTGAARWDPLAEARESMLPIRPELHAVIFIP